MLDMGSRFGKILIHTVPATNDLAQDAKNLQEALMAHRDAVKVWLIQTQQGFMVVTNDES